MSFFIEAPYTTEYGEHSVVRVGDIVADEFRFGGAGGERPPDMRPTPDWGHRVLVAIERISRISKMRGPAMLYSGVIVGHLRKNGWNTIGEQWRRSFDDYDRFGLERVVGPVPGLPGRSDALEEHMRLAGIRQQDADRRQEEAREPNDMERFRDWKTRALAEDRLPFKY